MTSGIFHDVPVNSIIVPADRQRKNFTGIEELAESIERTKHLIHPILIRRDNVLVAGERRLRAHEHLGRQLIRIQYTDEIDPDRLHLIELEENLRRENLTWQEQVQAISDYHELRKKITSDHSRADTQEALGISSSALQKTLLVKKAMDEGLDDVVNSPAFSTAYNFASRRAERQEAAVMAEVASVLPELTTPALESSQNAQPSAPSKPTRRASIITQDALEFMTSPALEHPYNFIHCDFPYGVNVDKKGQSSAKVHGGYKDTKEIYFELLNAFVEYQDAFIAPSAHVMFWFSMDYYQHTYDTFTEAGWIVNKFPLIWGKSDNAGILPDSQRGPRRIYETAFLMSRGDRKIVKAVGNTYWGATTKTYHMSEKPHAMLSHFFRMFVDSSSRVLDPTCGSGMAIKVAEELGAMTAVGLEKDADFADRARQNLNLL